MQPDWSLHLGLKVIPSYSPYDRDPIRGGVQSLLRVCCWGVEPIRMLSHLRNADAFLRSGATNDGVSLTQMSFRAAF